MAKFRNVGILPAKRPRRSNLAFFGRATLYRLNPGNFAFSGKSRFFRLPALLPRPYRSRFWWQGCPFISETRAFLAKIRNVQIPYFLIAPYVSRPTDQSGHSVAKFALWEISPIGGLCVPASLFLGGLPLYRLNPGNFAFSGKLRFFRLPPLLPRPCRSRFWWQVCPFISEIWTLLAKIKDAQTPYFTIAP